VKIDSPVIGFTEFEKRVQSSTGEIAMKSNIVKDEPSLTVEEKADDSFKVQSLIFPKDKWDDAAAAKKWAKDHGYKTEIDETDTSYRMRQDDPEKFVRLRTICINPGNDAPPEDCKVKAVGGPLKGRSLVGQKSHTWMSIKGITEEGTFEGILSPYGNVDLGGDVVEPGAYTKTLKDRGNTVPLLWQHRSDMPIGELALEDRADGLYCKGKLLMALPEAQRAYLLLKSRIIKGLSIGFETIKDEIKDGIRRLKEIKLYEGSIVTFPMNEAAMVNSIKAKLGEAKGDFTEELGEIQIQDGYGQVMRALDNSLWSLLMSDLTADEKIAASKTVVEQFVEAFNTVFPEFIRWIDGMHEPSESWAAKRDLELKVGAAISSSNADRIRGACQKLMACHDDLMALVEDKAVPDGNTLPQQAASEQKTEPAQSHSAAEKPEEAALMEILGSLVSCAKGQ
jgi:HK97 family phage prohead protease